MGKYSGKVLTVYISPTGVRVCEGENRNGNPDIGNFFVITDVEEYFSRGSDVRSPEIINMSGLVEVIANECKEHNINARRVMVCSDCFDLNTTIDLTIGGGVKSILSRDIGKKKGVDTAPPGSMTCKCAWGEVVRDGAVHKVTSETVGDKYLLKSLCQEFYRRGYEVIFLSGAKEVLLNFRQTEPADFDSQGKIIFNFDTDCTSAILTKDIPVEYQTLPMLPSEELLERLQAMINYAMGITGRNPRIYLAGSVFSDTALYNSFLDYLELEGYLVYDLFERPVKDDEYFEKLASGEIHPILTADFSANIAMLMMGFSKTIISLTPQLGFEESLKKNSKALATVLAGACALFFVVSLVLSGIRLYKVVDARNNPSNLSNLQMQLQNLTMRQQSLNSTIATLTQADTLILELVRFVEENQDDRVTVLSIDTKDMLTSDEDDGYGMSVTVDGADTTEEEVTGESGKSEFSRASIVMRGYAKTGNEAVSYYNKLFNVGLPVDPVLNGVERYELPDGDEVYIFEIEIGGEQSE